MPDENVQNILLNLQKMTTMVMRQNHLRVRKKCHLRLPRLARASKVLSLTIVQIYSYHPSTCKACQNTACTTARSLHHMTQ